MGKYWLPTDYVAYRNNTSFDSAGVYNKVYEDPEIVIWKKVRKARQGTAYAYRGSETYFTPELSDLRALD